MPRDGASRELSTGEQRKILCIGRARELLSLRAMVLGGAGFHVVEERDVTRAVQLALEDSIDLVLLCHSLNSSEQSRIIHLLRAMRQNVLIASVIASDHHSAPAGSLAVPSDPLGLIDALRKMFQEPRGAQASN